MIEFLVENSVFQIIKADIAACLSLSPKMSQCCQLTAFYKHGGRSEIKIPSFIECNDY